MLCVVTSKTHVGAARSSGLTCPSLPPPSFFRSSISHKWFIASLQSIYRCAAVRQRTHAAPPTMVLESAPETTTEQPTPALEATLQALEWRQLCEDLASFAKTSLGKEQLRALHPTKQQHMPTDTLAAIALTRDLAADLDFGGVPTADAHDALRRVIKGGVATGTQLNAVAGVLISAGRLQRTVQQAARAAGSDATLLATVHLIVEAMAALIVPRKVIDEVQRCVEEEDGRVRDSASEEVRRTRARVVTLANRVRGVLRGYPGEVTEVNGRLALAVAKADAGSISKAVLLGSSAGGAIVYVEPGSVVPGNNELAAARGECFAAEEAVLSKLSMLCAEHAEHLQHVLDVLVWLDVAVAKAEYGLWVNGHVVRETVWPHEQLGGWERRGEKEGGEEEEEEGRLVFRLKQLRHPLLLAKHLRDHQRRQRLANSQSGSSSRRLSTRKQPASVGGGVDGSDAPAVPPPVPVDVCVSPGVRGLIITGPNTGGKTATLKAVGLAVLMAQCGIPVPAQHPILLPPVSSVLADVGDEQSLEASLSTFSGHLRRIQAIRAESDGASLVLLDEVGTGTDPLEGSALGLALLRTLVRGGFGGAGFVMATTHHSALTGLKYEDPRFENASVGFDEIALAPTYRLQWGVPGRSNALNIAQRLGLEEGVVEDARARLGVAQAEVNQGIAVLEDLRRQVDMDEQAVGELLGREEQLQRQLRAAKREAAQQEMVLTVQQRNVCAAAIAKAKQQLGQLEEQQARADRAAQRAAQREAQRAQQAEAAVKREAKIAAWRPKVGQRVVVPKLNAMGKVSKIQGGKLTVQVGLLKVELQRDEVEPAQ